MRNIINQLGEHLNELKAMIYAVFIFLNIDTDVVKILMFLMLLDTFFGVWKSQVLNEVFKFKVLLDGLVSKVFVILLPMTVALMGKGLGYEFTSIVDIVIRILVAAEGLSILSSFYMIRTKKRIENIDVITMLITALRNWFMKLINGMLGRIENPAGVPVENETNKEENGSDNIRQD